MNTTEQQQRSRKSGWFVFLGLVLLAGAAGLAYFAYKYLAVSTVDTYSYTVNQSVNSTVTYNDSSFFDNGPTTEDTAYLSDLTDTVTARFQYNYEADAVEELTYTYDVEATVRSVYGLDGNDDVSNVWTEHFQLIAPVTKTTTDRNFTISESTAIPYQEYRALAEQIRTGLALPVATEAYVELSVKITGEYKGTPFSESQTSRVSVPLNVQIYQPQITYDGLIAKDVAAATTGDTNSALMRYAAFIGALVAAILGIVSLLYGFRASLFKSSYQRELERIYRYHEGIIIRTGRPVRYAGKQVVPVASFDDILNLEEELKVPIVASPLDTQSTQFMISSGDIVYVYTLGETVSVQVDELDELADVAAEEVLDGKGPSLDGVHRPAGRRTGNHTTHHKKPPHHS